jgi:hypothetical protein
MGDNALANWEWKNTVVGEGYQAKGVIRQRTAQTTAPVKVTNMSAPRPAPPAVFPQPPPPPPSHKEGRTSSDDRKKRHRDDGSDDDDDSDGDDDDNDDGGGRRKSDKKRKKEKDSKKSKKEHRKKEHRESSHSSSSRSSSSSKGAAAEKDEFNPILQCLAQRLSNKVCRMHGYLPSSLLLSLLNACPLPFLPRPQNTHAKDARVHAGKRLSAVAQAQTACTTVRGGTRVRAR